MQILFQILFLIVSANGVVGICTTSTGVDCNPLGFPLRSQWNANGGYCGETSMIITGLRLGQYFSQFDMRQIYSGSTIDQSINNQFLLLGANSQTTTTVTALRLASISWSGAVNTNSFLVWVKQNFLNGYAVTIGVYMNQGNAYFGGAPGDPTYDHIVTVTNIISSHPNDGVYYADDQICIDDHGLWGVTLPYQYIYCYTFSGFQATRSAANTNTNVYSLSIASSANTINYGVAVTGTNAAAGATLPVSLSFNSVANAETPEIVDFSNTRPLSTTITLTVTVSNVVPDVTYKLYQYNDITKVPSSNFNANAINAFAVTTFKVPYVKIHKSLRNAAFVQPTMSPTSKPPPTTTTWTTTVTIKSSDRVIFRAVSSAAL